MRNGCDVVLESFDAEGVDTVFGYPGGAIINLYDTLYDADLNHVLTRHEQAAAHAADGYARATGEVGVCLSTSGPGATNLVTGIATAHMDSVPILAVTGQVPTGMIGNDAFQEADVTGITMPITKHNYLVQDADELPGVMREAFFLANTGRPGPVVVDLPKDVQTAETDVEYPSVDDVKRGIRGYSPTYGGHPRQVKRAAEAISGADRPVVYAGGGVIASGASRELRRLAEITGAPVTTTLMGLGAFDERDPLSLGMLGMHGTKAANYAVTESDLLIAVGARFDDRVTGKLDAFAPNATVIHIDVDPAEISKNVEAHVPIVGDAGDVLGELNSTLEEMAVRDGSEWREKVKRWKREYPLDYEESDDVIKPQSVVEAINQHSPEDTVIATEVGQCQMWAAQFFDYTKPRSLVSSGGLGTMGYGFPAAIGAQVGRPGATVWDVAGDGSLQMNIQELATVALNDIPVKVAILNNGYLGMVRQWQELFFGERYSSTDLDQVPDFARVAESYGVKGVTVERPSEVEDAVREALEHDGPVVLDFRVAREENVFPMVPAGAAINEILEG
ncbi:MAG: 3D-(3,5/4)-trihydroxycyclohexane-1,2-dione hydrolase [Methanonatronarchaeales archaeon]|nr:3D-(3,5/4)-trihydroxycyclohexane-1,2-dione hydrolase [Methanonatronarchaeales archaeon]